MRESVRHEIFVCICLVTDFHWLRDCRRLQQRTRLMDLARLDHHLPHRPGFLSVDAFQKPARVIYLRTAAWALM